MEKRKQRKTPSKIPDELLAKLENMPGNNQDLGIDYAYFTDEEIDRLFGTSPKPLPPDELLQ